MAILSSCSFEESAFERIRSFSFISRNFTSNINLDLPSLSTILLVKKALNGDSHHVRRSNPKMLKNRCTLKNLYQLSSIQLFNNERAFYHIGKVVATSIIGMDGIIIVDVPLLNSIYDHSAEMEMASFKTVFYNVYSIDSSSTFFDNFFSRLSLFFSA